MKKLNKLLSCIMLVCTAMTLFGSVCANALTGFDSDAKCLLRVLVLNEHDLEQPVTDAEVTLYRAADVEFADEQAKYPCTDDFKGCAEQLENVSSEDNAEKLFDYAVKNRLKGITLVTDETGKVEFSELQPGVYLIAEIRSNNYNFARFKPFLAVLPYDNDGEWVFTVTAMPKISNSRLEFDKDVTVRKIWNDDGKNRPESISVQLLSGNEVLDTVSLSDKNGWMHTWTELDSGKVYSVKETDVPEGYTVTYSETNGGFIINNTRSLIKTGQLRWPIPVLGISGLAFLVIGFLLKRSSKEHE